MTINRQYIVLIEQFHLSSTRSTERSLFYLGAKIFVVQSSLCDGSAQPVFQGAIFLILSIVVTPRYFCRANNGHCCIQYHPYDDRGGSTSLNFNVDERKGGKDIVFVVSPLLGSRGVPPYCWRYCHTNM